MQPQQWATEQFGALELGDTRRTHRVVELAAALFARPEASLPEQLGDPAALKATYRLLNTDALTHAGLLAPHWQMTRQAACEESLILFVQDASELDYTAHPHTSGLGPIGNGGGRGLLLQSMLAIRPTTRTVVGLAYQCPTIRQPAPKGESCPQRRHRERESQVWLAGIHAVGSPPTGTCWVHIGDRYADMWSFFTTCQATQTDFLVRVAQDRRVVDQEGIVSHVFARCATLVSYGERSLPVTARAGRRAREAHLQMAAGPVRVLPPRQPAGQDALDLWLIWVHEVGTTPADEEPIDWVLLTSVPTTNEEHAWERVEWYQCRWIIEEYHQCLKTGCGIERRQLESREALERLLAISAVQAVALLHLRDLARSHPQTLAALALPPEVVRVVAFLAGVAPALLTMAQVWRVVARKGGFPGRKGDGQPGWRTLWRGWLAILHLVEGVQLAPLLAT
jgi:hypothetical protein